jgi:anti-sigma regulatory factor (Ser/Thr protein kinase)
MEREEMRIANRLSEIERVADWVDRFSDAHRLPPEVLSGLHVSLDEVLSNIISYAYADGGEHEILVRLALGDGLLTAEIEDDGLPFDPLGVPPPDQSPELSERRIGGLGVHFLKALNDDIAYERVGNKNRLRLCKGVPPG